MNKTSKLDNTLTLMSIGTQSTLISTLLCLVKCTYSDKVPTAAVQGKQIFVNQEFFDNLPKKSAITLLKHELFHIARGHSLRIGNRNPNVWNKACDIVINNGLARDGESFEGLEDGLYDLDLDPTLSEEEVYDLLRDEEVEQDYMPDILLVGDSLSDEDGLDLAGLLSEVQEALKASSDTTDQQIIAALNKALHPDIDWKAHINRFLMDIIENDFKYSYQRPSRRDYSTDIRLPKLMSDETKILTQLNIYVDISGSVSIDQLNRIMSELYNIKKYYPDVSIRIVTFNTNVVSDCNLEDYNLLSAVVSGGTDINVPISHAIENSLDNIIVFTDLDSYYPIDWSKLNMDNFLWVILNSPSVVPVRGSYIHIRDV